MAAITPDTVRNHNIGSNTLIEAVFSAGTADDADTWASGLSTRVINFWAQDQQDDTTQASGGVSVTNSSGTFTFYPGEDNMPFSLFVMVSGC
jgi:hypothetical protein